MEAIFEFIIFILFSIPGAFFRWLLSGCRHHLEALLKMETLI
jgi:hypothetical protein